MDQVDLMFVRDAIVGMDAAELAQAVDILENNIELVEVDATEFINEATTNEQPSVA